ncbi:MAG: hypothetical protein ABJF23_02405 [Bryobacteraceae bacterium]
MANPQTQTAASSGISIRFIEGQGAINNVNRGAAFEPVVEVVDGEGMPIKDAGLTFTLPAAGAGGTFPDGGKVLITRTDENGKATARGMRPNRLTGQFEIRVTANYNGQSATSVLTQTNAAPSSAEHGSGKKWAIILGIVGGAAAAGVVAASGGGGSSSAAPPASAATPPAGSVTPGAPGFGAPR